MPHIIVSTRVFATDPQLDAHLLDENYSELVVSLIETMCIGASDKKLTDCFLPEMKNIVVQICCNLIKLSKSEAEQMRDDPQEYINFSLDCCDKQHS